MAAAPGSIPPSENPEILVIDLRDRIIKTPNEFWDAMQEPCGLPDWFGRNLDACKRCMPPAHGIDKH
jgi:hypothetical protein